MDSNVVFYLVAAGLVAVILLLRYIVNNLINKADDAIQNSRAKKKNEEHVGRVGEEQKLSDLYKST